MTLEELKNRWPVLRTVSLEHGPGWYGIIDLIMSAISTAGFDTDRDEIRQVKEKFGTLKFYIACDVHAKDGHESNVHESRQRLQRILQAINDNNTSGKTCEQCGKMGQLLVSAGWWSTRCTEHASEGAMPPGQYFAMRASKARPNEDGA